MFRKIVPVFLAISALARGKLSNVTIDDGNASISYSPVSAWSSGLSGGCGSSDGCLAKDILTKDLYLQSWHEGTSDANEPTSLTFVFSGVAIYVKGVVATSSSSPLGRTDATFFVDGVEMGTFQKALSENSRRTTYAYDQLLFSFEGPTLNLNTEHTLVVYANETDENSSVLLLDSITYTVFEDDDDASPQATTTSTLSDFVSTPTQSSTVASSSSHKSSAGTIAGAVLGCIAGLAIIAICFLVYRRRRTNENTVLPTSHDSSPSPSSGRLAQSGFNPDLLVQRSPTNSPATARSARHPTLNSALLGRVRNSFRVSRNQPHSSPLEEEIMASVRPDISPVSPALIQANERLLSICNWRLQTDRQAPQAQNDGEIPDMSEELSSYYETSTTTQSREDRRSSLPARLPAPPPIPASRPRPKPKRFTVMNN